MKFAIVPLCLMLLARSSSALSADPEACRQLLASQLQAYREPDVPDPYFEDAEKAYRDCRGEKLPLDIRIAALLKYGVARDVGGETQAAIDAFREAIETLDRVPGDHASMMIDVLDHIVTAEEQALLDSAAIEHSTRALTLRQETYGEESPEAVQGMVTLAIAHATSGDYDKSESLLRAAVRMAERTCGPECKALSEAYSGMYALYATQGREAEAKKYDELALNARPVPKRDSATKD